LVFPGIETGITAAENSYFVGIYSGLALLALVPGVALFVWGLRAIREESGSGSS